MASSVKWLQLMDVVRAHPDLTIDLFVQIISSVKMRGPFGQEEEVGLNFYHQDYDRALGVTTYYGRPGFVKFTKDGSGYPGMRYSQEAIDIISQYYAEYPAIF